MLKYDAYYCTTPHGKSYSSLQCFCNFLKITCAKISSVQLHNNSMAAKVNLPVQKKWLQTLLQYLFCFCTKSLCIFNYFCCCKIKHSIIVQIINTAAKVSNYRERYLTRTGTYLRRYGNKPFPSIVRPVLLS